MTLHSTQGRCGMWNCEVTIERMVWFGKIQRTGTGSNCFLYFVFAFVFKLACFLKVIKYQSFVKIYQWWTGNNQANHWCQYDSYKIILASHACLCWDVPIGSQPCLRFLRRQHQTTLWTTGLSVYVTNNGCSGCNGCNGCSEGVSELVEWLETKTVYKLKPFCLARSVHLLWKMIPSIWHIFRNSQDHTKIRYVT